jgi:NAD(P)H dehydrogenase (quinone)
MKEQINLLILYYSATGANFQMAQWAAETAELAGAQVRMHKCRETAPKDAIEQNKVWKANVEAMAKVKEVSLEDLDWADAILFSCPTRYGSVPAQVKAFLDTTGGLWSKGKLANKTVSAMATAANPHGGQEATILSLYTQLMHWGCIIVAPGYTAKATFEAGGNPYGTSGTVDEKGHIKEKIEGGVRYQTTRLLEVTQWIKDGV